MHHALAIGHAERQQGTWPQPHQKEEEAATVKWEGEEGGREGGREDERRAGWQVGIDSTRAPRKRKERGGKKGEKKEEKQRRKIWRRKRRRGKIEQE
jgi:hypothetical protein